MSEPFHQYDIRGIFNDTLTNELATKIGKSIVKKFNLKKIIIGRDHRISSPELFNSLTKGIIENGCDVLDIGVTATPILYHFCVTQNFPIGIMITASHNPKEYNGFKICTNEGQLITYDAGMSDVEELIKNNDIEIGNTTTGKIIKKEENQVYINYIKSKLNNLSKKYKIVIDTGNGSAGPIVKSILKDIPNIKLTEMFFELDGNYPNHESNPLKLENIQDLKQRITEEKADFGFAFDGDADRCILLDELGNMIYPDMLLCVIAQEELKKHPNETFYFDLRFSKITKEYIESLGGKAVMLKVGNPEYKKKMVYEGGCAAAELSGHMFYKENYSLDDGFFHMIKVINYIDSINKKVSEIIKPFQKYFQSDEINLKIEKKDKVIEELKNKYSDSKILELDGVTIKYSEYWFNVRKSNTEPLLRLRIEANTKILLDEKIKEVTEFIKTFN